MPGDRSTGSVVPNVSTGTWAHVPGDNVRITNCELHAVNYKYPGKVHVVLPLATCVRNGYAIPLGYAEF